MKATSFSFRWNIIVCVLMVALATPSLALPPGPSVAPWVISPELHQDRTVTFRLYAPKAQSVRLVAGDSLSKAGGDDMQKGGDGAWSITIGPVTAGTYTYYFNVDDVIVSDPANPQTSEAARNAMSVLYVPGADFQDIKNVPHGVIETVTYYSTTIGAFRRMQIYTPPGYGVGMANYPVLYLLHGGSGSDDSWPTVGHAGFIMDNLFATGKARPMIVVMPDANITHILPLTDDDFAKDFLRDVMPYVENNYRVLADRSDRAIAGFSQGGVHTLILGLTNLDKFSYLGVFSSGLMNMYGFGAASKLNVPGIKTARLEPSEPNWEAEHKAALDDPKLKQGLKLIWFAVGKDDFVFPEHQKSVDLLKKHKFDVQVEVTDGGHTYMNARAYLAKFAQKLFR